MPELPEVETVSRGIRPLLLKQKITQIIVRQPKLRWTIPRSLNNDLKQQTIQQVTRRGKYLLLATENGTIIIHLGMSGVLLVQPQQHTWAKHEHVNIILANGYALCFIDPRRFGTILWTTQDPQQHRLLKHLGPEPLTRDFNARYLINAARRHKCTIKQFIMNNHIVVGVGNIYATEALFLAKIHPTTPANQVSAAHLTKLVTTIKQVLKLAIKNSGTTIRDYATSDGKPGNFQHRLYVYGRQNQPCKKCKTILQAIRLGQRNTVFCPSCQK